MINVLRTKAENRDFIDLVNELDQELKQSDGEDYTFFSQFNTIDKIHQVVVAYVDGIAIGCGALRHYDQNTIELKRMYTSPKNRRNGVASKILSELEDWAGELGYEVSILETGIQQEAAVKMYKKNGYSVIPNYGPYSEIDVSVCFRKNLKRQERSF